MIWLTCASVHRSPSIGCSRSIAFDLIEKGVDGAGQIGVHVQRQTGLRDLGGHPPPLREVSGSRRGGLDEHRVVQRPVQALAVGDVIDERVALPHLASARNLRQRALDLLRASGGRAGDAEHAHVELLLRRQPAVERQHVGLAAGAAERGEAGPVHVPDHAAGAAFERVAGGRRQPRGQRPDPGFFDGAGRLPLGVADDPGLAPGVVEAERLHGRGVEERLVVRRLQQQRMPRRHAIELVARERPRRRRRTAPRPSRRACRSTRLAASARTRARRSSSACARDPTPSSRTSHCHVVPARSRCMWLSMSPGMTARPAEVDAPRGRPCQPCDVLGRSPTGAIRSPRMATASATVKRSSTVMILPLERIRSSGRLLCRQIEARHPRAQRSPRPR